MASSSGFSDEDDHVIFKLKKQTVIHLFIFATGVAVPIFESEEKVRKRRTVWSRILSFVLVEISHF